MNIYFVSGFLANCHIFDRIKLPDGFEKKYIEWHIPKGDETLLEYAEKMSESIDREKPFALVGCSFGGLVIQEMNKFLKPEKNIIISSIKNEQEVPTLFQLGRKVNFAERFPMDILSKTSVLSKLFVKYVYHIPPSESSEFTDNTDPVYMKWAIRQILNWMPTVHVENLYHIHGTKDLTFPIKPIQNAFVVENGDHLMVMKKSRQINKILEQILTEK